MGGNSLQAAHLFMNTHIIVNGNFGMGNTDTVCSVGYALFLYGAKVVTGLQVVVVELKTLLTQQVDSIKSLITGMKELFSSQLTEVKQDVQETKKEVHDIRNEIRQVSDRHDRQHEELRKEIKAVDDKHDGRYYELKKQVESLRLDRHAQDKGNSNHL